MYVIVGEMLSSVDSKVYVIVDEILSIYTVDSKMYVIADEMLFSSVDQGVLLMRCYISV